MKSRLALWLILGVGLSWNAPVTQADEPFTATTTQPSYGRSISQMTTGRNSVPLSAAPTVGGFAQRLGPGVRLDGSVSRATESPRIMDVQNDRSTPSGVTNGSQNDREALEAWVVDVQTPFRLRQLDSQIKTAEAKLASYRQRGSQLAQYNVYASPETAAFTPSDIWPGVETYNPVTRPGPVRAFSPRSSFSHVLAALETTVTQTEAALEDLQQKRDVLATRIDEDRLTDVLTESAPTVEDVRTLQMTVDADLRRTQFKRDSYEWRVRQADSLSTLVFANAFTNLQQDLRLGLDETEQRLDDLRYYQQLVRSYEQSQQARPVAPRVSPR